jgi:riboflavin synthase
VLEINSKLTFKNRDIGSSVSCSGACLTLDKIKKNNMIFYVSMETIKRTNFKFLKKNDIINLEKSMIFGQRISGHFVQGHIDTTGMVSNIKYIGKSWLISFYISKKFRKFIIYKGSIAINGVSLTISKIIKEGFQISVIPKTLKLTNLMNLEKKDVVNVEFDMVGKYIKSFS